MRTIPIIMILLFVFPSLAKTHYGLQDLEILASEGSYEEFFKHALDIRPSERLDPWKSMVSKMAEVFAQSVLKKTTIELAQFNKTEDLFAWPSLKTDDVFKLRRQEIGLRFLKKCLKDENPCTDKLLSFWEADKSDAENAFKLYELTHELKSSINTWEFLEVSLKSPLSEFFCKKPTVMSALWKKLGVDYIRLGPKGDLLMKIDQTIHPDCLLSLNKEAFQKLHSPGEPEDRELSYQILKSQGKANAEITDFFLTVYLLEHPSQGELFNISWNNLLELNRSSDRRAQVLKTIKNLDPAPDALFSSLDLTKKKAILRHFKANFPEYLDYYTNLCTDYYGGKKRFPLGNPTMNCQNLMKSELAIPYLGNDKVNQYLKVKNI